MAIGVRSFEGKITVKWAGTAKGIPGCGIKLSADETGNYATAQTDVPLGVLMNDPEPYDSSGAPERYDNATVHLAGTGDVIRAVAGGAVALNALVTVDSAGRFVTATIAGTQDGTADWIWGRCVKAAGAANDYIELQLLASQATLT